MDKTLYLSEKKQVDITRDGPSIWVREDGKAGRRIPARIVDKVIVFGNVKIATEIITLFADHNVPMVFINKKRGETAVSMPHNNHLDNHYDEQKVILKTEENIGVYSAWMNNQRKEIQLDVMKRLSINVASCFRDSGFSEQDYQGFVMRTAWIHEKKWKAVDNIINGLSLGMVLRKLIEAKLDPHLGVLHRRQNYGLAMDIRYIIDAEFDMQTIQFFKDNPDGKYFIRNVDGWLVTREGMLDVAKRYENRKQAIQELTGQIIDSLFVLIRRLRS
ncbi:MAG: CRISPR-associated endonuclease Cas1 [Syntrophorhabdaceae bacterium]|nr:CRISPR-associated endonuclease Cas1 [Syntrophorhabdaceae bacterium]MDD5242906.1 CRISPR-associated endonuclease Cas1 [Syntrophorhabdaceae bacterium]